MICETSSARSCIGGVPVLLWEGCEGALVPSVRHQGVLHLVKSGAERTVDDDVSDAGDDPGDEGRVLATVDDDALARHLLEPLLKARVVVLAQAGRRRDLGPEHALAEVAHLSEELRDRGGRVESAS